MVAGCRCCMAPLHSFFQDVEDVLDRLRFFLDETVHKHAPLCRALTQAQGKRTVVAVVVAVVLWQRLARRGRAGGGGGGARLRGAVVGS
jgi:hypothetical protein